jgi:hypothetical protein
MERQRIIVPNRSDFKFSTSAVSHGVDIDAATIAVLNPLTSLGSL